MNNENIKKPKMYNVVLMNSNHITFDFLISVITEVFKLNINESYDKSIEVINKGSVKIGPFIKDIAHKKHVEICQISQSHNYSLNSYLEKEDE